jgi:hypothetical protein
LLFSFGPFGMDVCDGPYRVFTTWHRRNSIMIELTSERLRAIPNKSFGFLTIPARKHRFGVKLPFEIPYDEITLVRVQPHPSPIALMDILDIQYAEGGVILEKSIASYRNNVARAYEIIAAACPGRAC